MRVGTADGTQLSAKPLCAFATTITSKKVTLNRCNLRILPRPTLVRPGCRFPPGPPQKITKTLASQSLRQWQRIPTILRWTALRQALPHPESSQEPSLCSAGPGDPPPDGGVVQEAAQVLGQRARSCIAPSWLLLQTFEADRFQVAMHLPIDLPRSRRFFVYHLAQYLRHRVCRERGAAGQ